MTKAVCFQCGQLKPGAFSRCQKCRAAPLSDDELAISIAFNEHNFDRASLERIGSEIAAGRCPLLDDATRAKLLPGVQEAKRLLNLGSRAKEVRARKQNSFFSMESITKPILKLWRRSTQFGSHRNNQDHQVTDRSDQDLEFPLAAHCIRISTPIALSEVMEATTRQSTQVDARARAMALVIMSASGHFIRGLIEDTTLLRSFDEVQEYRPNSNMDVLTAETMVWISVVLGQLWKADQRSDRSMYERVGLTTISTANRLCLDTVRHLTGADFRNGWLKSRRFYLDAFNNRSDLHEAFTSMLTRANQRSSLIDQPSDSNAPDFFAPELLPLSVYVMSFFSTMPQAYYMTFKKLLLAWPERFP